MNAEYEELKKQRDILRKEIAELETNPPIKKTVFWKDAYTVHGKLTQEEIDKREPYSEMYSTGYVVRDDSECLMLAQTYASETKQYIEISCIPKCLIIKTLYWEDAEIIPIIPIKKEEGAT